MRDGQGQLRETFRNDWLQRHRRRERLAMKSRWNLARFCQRCGIEYEVETAMSGEMKVKRFLFCYDGEVVTWEPFDGRMTFEQNGKVMKVHSVRVAKKRLANRFKVMES